MADVQRYNVVTTADMSQPGVDGAGNPITVDVPSGTVINTILWDGVTPYSPPENTELVLVSD